MKIKLRKFFILNILLIILTLSFGCNTNFLNKKKSYNSFKSKIITLNRLSELPKYTSNDCLVIFDIDLTILRETLKDNNNHKYFFDSSLYKLIRSFIYKQNKDKIKNIIKKNKPSINNDQINIIIEKKINKKMHNLWPNIEPKINYVLMDKKIPKLISNLQSQKIKTMAFTAREWKMHLSTLNDLNNANINIDKDTIYDGKILVKPKNGKYGYGYKNGVISIIRSKKFTQDTQKGRILLDFFKKINFTPKKVIFIDNRIDNVKDVFKYLQNQKIPVLGIWYKYKNYKKNLFLQKKDIDIISNYLGENWWEIHTNNININFLHTENKQNLYLTI